MLSVQGQKTERAKTRVGTRIRRVHSIQRWRRARKGDRRSRFSPFALRFTTCFFSSSREKVLEAKRGSRSPYAEKLSYVPRCSKENDARSDCEESDPRSEHTPP
ncbi:hypothetical protein KM043_002665 [Ampulex compressa]|nr:hypothetical protein KM043_002665 [Ampulex compressa]